MPTPQGIRTVTLRGRLVEPDLLGTPLAGTLTFTPNVPRVIFPVENTLMAGTETAILDNNGEFVIDLPCTDTPQQTPDGWTYTVVEKLIGVSQRSYQILLPFTLAVVELADIVPTVKAPTYLPVVGPQGPPGLVTSVNGVSAANITLSAANVGAVSLTTSETIAGTKTFSTIPVLPASDPTTANQATRKSYVDAGNATAVKLTGDQSIAGIKTFANAVNVNTTFTAVRFRATTAADMSMTSTDHGFQIGLDSGSNLRMDDNEIQSALNGAVNPLFIQPEGGNLGFFTSRTVNSVVDVLTVRGTVGINKLNLVQVQDVSPTSTDHPFQIGDSTGLNMRMDTNEFMAINNGLPSNLHINGDGGGVTINGNLPIGDMTYTVDVRANLSASNQRTLMDWTPLSSLGTYQTGFSAGSPLPRMRKGMENGVEVWEMEGKIIWTAGTLPAGTTTVAFIFNTGHRVAAERGFQLYGIGTNFYGIRSGILNTGNLTLGIPTAGGAGATGVSLEAIRITNPASV